ncbi:MAG: hypothetical protein EBT13_18145 [Rhodobacteraceae bacterium]|nr:hypothetical protein [Paracoccaceae bacterium]
MGDAKRLIVKPISAKDANRIVQSLHYSGKTVQNSQLHLGVFLDGKCGGAMQFGPSLDKRKIQGLVRGTLWNEFIELNRMAFADWLPRNGESRALGFAFRWMRKQYPQLKWCVSFADGTQCGDGTIYRASGFALTGITHNNSIIELPSGEKVASMTFTKGSHILKQNGRAGIPEGSKRLPGFQLRYIYFIDPSCKEKLTVPILPFSEIDRVGAGMYKGKPRVTSADSGTLGNPAEKGRCDSDRNAFESS